MPTPDETVLPPSPPQDLTSRNSFASCPPDDECAPSEPTGEESDSDVESVAATGDTEEIEESDRAATLQQPTPEPESQIIETYEPTRPKQRSTKAAEEDDEDEAVRCAAPSRVAHGKRDGEVQVEAPSMSSPCYLSFPPDYDRVGPSTTTTYLYPGSKFQGTQQSDRQVYDVQVEIKDVDLAESFLCGYLRIQGLTDDHPTLTTFFEGEIIGTKHLFRTNNPSWGSSEKTDLAHWARFPAWRPFAKAAKSPTFTLRNYARKDHLFMRWKEYFLVPDHRVKTITGASFEGFYYICFDQRVGSVSGIYFHAKSEKYQQLELKHVREGGMVAAMEFR